MEQVLELYRIARNDDGNINARVVQLCVGLLFKSFKIPRNGPEVRVARISAEEFWRKVGAFHGIHPTSDIRTEANERFWCTAAELLLEYLREIPNFEQVSVFEITIGLRRCITIYIDYYLEHPERISAEEVEEMKCYLARLSTRFD